MKQLKFMFSLVKHKNPGKLDLEEFKAFLMSKEVNQTFRKIMKRLREREPYKHPENKAILLPYSFASLLNFLASKLKQSQLRDEIFSEKELDPDEWIKDSVRFQKLINEVYQNNLNSELDNRALETLKHYIDHEHKKRSCKIKYSLPNNFTLDENDFNRQKDFSSRMLMNNMLKEKNKQNIYKPTFKAPAHTHSSSSKDLQKLHQSFASVSSGSSHSSNSPKPLKLSNEAQAEIPKEINKWKLGHF